jgi:hypothetical protein
VLAASGDLDGYSPEYNIALPLWRFVITDVLDVRVAELPFVRCAPAQERARHRSRAGVLFTGHELHRQCAKLDRSRRSGGLVIANILRVSVAKLAEVISAPAHDRVIFAQRTDVPHARNNLDSGAPQVHVDGIFCIEKRAGFG